MIKLIATDMDGTFLNNAKQMPAATDAVLAKLKEMGIRFVVASGREYHSLEKRFLNHLEDTVFIAENGALVVENQEIVFSAIVPAEEIRLCLDVVATLENVEIVVCGRHCEYTSTPEMYAFFTDPKMQYDIEMVESLYDYTENAVKMNIILTGDKTNKEAYDQLKAALPESLHIAISGLKNIDIGAVGVNKGTALAKLQEKWGITPEETATFGDQFNDVELLDCGYYSYAMEGADEGVQAHARFAGGSNDDGFVLKEICRLVGLSENGEKIE